MPGQPRLNLLVSIPAQRDLTSGPIRTWHTPGDRYFYSHLRLKIYSGFFFLL